MTAVATSEIVGFGKRTLRSRVGKPLAYLLLAFIIIVTLYPFFWAFRSALSTNPALLAGEFDFTWANFKRVLGLASDEEILAASGRVNTGEFDFLLALRNSVIIATSIAVGQVFFSATAAYAFARLKFAGRDRLFFLYLTGMMIPPIITLVPNLLLMKDLGWLNSFRGIIAPYFLMTPFAVFFLRQFFLSVNRELEEAALIDGAGHFRIFWSVVLPIVRPQMITLAVLTYVTAWNEFLWPLVVGRGNEGVRPLTVALNEFTVQQPGNSPDWSGLLAGTLLAALPVVIIFALFGKRIVDSIRFTGIK